MAALNKPDFLPFSLLRTPRLYLYSVRELPVREGVAVRSEEEQRGVAGCCQVEHGVVPM